MLSMISTILYEIKSKAIIQLPLKYNLTQNLTKTKSYENGF